MKGYEKRYVWWAASGWYAKRLHAVPAFLATEGRTEAHAVCGAEVYAMPAHRISRDKLERSAPRCKRCEQKIAKEAKT